MLSRLSYGPVVVSTGKHIQTLFGPTLPPPVEPASERVASLQAEAGIDEKEALKRLARELGQSKSELYRELQRERARVQAGSRGTR